MELSYCTNVHPAEDVDGIIAQLDAFAGPIRTVAGLDTLGVGLWLPAAAARDLAADPALRDELRRALRRNGLTLSTVNAFPFRGFHDDVVKRAVYRPDWTTDERVRHVEDCASVLCDLLAPGAVGSISTLPLGWREGWDAAADARAEENLARTRAHLVALRRATGRIVRVGIEPEPGCVLDSVADVVEWLGARPALTAGGYIGVCLDTCHLAVSFADPATTVADVAAAGIRIVKVQASVALEVSDASASIVADALAPFAEDRYLHQVRAGDEAGVVRAADDLPEVLAALGAGAEGQEWPLDRPTRVHVHIPVHAAPRAPLRATSDVLRAAAAAVMRTPGGADAHLDIETYTWSVLPEWLQPPTLVDGIAQELRWATTHLSHALAGGRGGHLTAPAERAS